MTAPAPHDPFPNLRASAAKWEAEKASWSPKFRAQFDQWSADVDASREEYEANHCEECEQELCACDAARDFDLSLAPVVRISPSEVLA